MLVLVGGVYVFVGGLVVWEGEVYVLWFVFGVMVVWTPRYMCFE